MQSDRQLRGAPARRPRLSDAETEERMLAAGERFVADRGLSLTLEHLSIENLIREAGVSRTSSYRRWPTKDAYAADLLVRLARAKLADDLRYLAGALDTIPTELFERLDSEQGRRDVVVEVLRVTTTEDYATTAASPRWRVYLMLRAAHLGLPEGEVRDEVARALRETERGFATLRAGALRSMVGVIGYRLRDPEVVDWETLSLTVSDLVTGMIVRAYADPDAVDATRPLAPFGTTRAADWSRAALACSGLILSALEPDPGVIWDAPHIEELREAASDFPALLERLWPGSPQAGDNASRPPR